MCMCNVFRLELVVLLMKEDLFTEGCHRHRATLPEQEVNWVEYEEVCCHSGAGVSSLLKGVTV